MKDKKETFGSNIGQGIGCFFILLGLGFLFMLLILNNELPELIKMYLERCR